MGLADRLFAYRGLPHGADRVTTLLWAVGWGIWLWLAVHLWIVLGSTPWTYDGPERIVVRALPLIMAGLLVAWSMIGTWVVSEAYRDWLAGHRYGKQWAVLIALFLVAGGFGQFLETGLLRPSLTWFLAFRLVEGSVGVVLLGTALMTRQPAKQTPAAPA